MEPKEIELLFVMRGGASFTVRLLDLTWTYQPSNGMFSRVSWRSNKAFSIVPGEIAAIVQLSPIPEGWKPIIPREEDDQHLQVTAVSLALSEGIPRQVPIGPSALRRKPQGKPGGKGKDLCEKYAKHLKHLRFFLPAQPARLVFYIFYVDSYVCLVPFQ